MTQPSSNLTQFVWLHSEPLATVLIALFAAVQLYKSQRDANMRAVFEHLREIDKRVQETWNVSREEARTDLLAYYKSERTDLTQGAKCYVALLNSLDILAFAVDKRLVNKRIVYEYIKTLVNPSVIPLSFIKDFRNCCGDEKVYEHLYGLVLSLMEASPTVRWFQRLVTKRRAL